MFSSGEPKLKLREYQIEAIEQIEEQRLRGVKGTILHLATGLGKTAVAAAYIDRFVDKDSRVLFLVNRDVLASQTVRSLKEYYPSLADPRMTRSGVSGIGIVMADKRDLYARIVVGSVQTLSSRTGITDRFSDMLAVAPFDLVIVDEAHFAVAPSYRHLFNAMPGVFRIGLTATPVRSDGLALRQPLENGDYVFENIAFSRDLRWGQRHGFLVPFCPPLSVSAQIDGRQVSLLDVENWQQVAFEIWEQHASDRPTIFFLETVQKSVEMAKYFRTQTGYLAAHVDADLVIDDSGKIFRGNAAKEARERLFNRLGKRQLHVICNCDVMTTGVDIPAVSCIFDLSPTRSAVVLTQRYGRGLRTSPGKTDLKLLIARRSNPGNVGLVLQGDLSGSHIPMVEESPEQIEMLITDAKLDQSPGSETTDNSFVGVADGVQVGIVSLFSSQPSAWYCPEPYDSASLSISANTAFFIRMPDLDYVERLNKAIEQRKALALQNVLFRETDVVLEALIKVREIVSGYSIWKVMSGKNAVNRGVVLLHVGDDLESCFAVAGDLLDQEGQSIFFSKYKGWRKQPASMEQIALLKRYGVAKIPKTKGEASALITHALSRRFVDGELNRILKYGYGNKL